MRHNFRVCPYFFNYPLGVCHYFRVCQSFWKYGIQAAVRHLVFISLLYEYLTWLLRGLGRKIICSEIMNNMECAAELGLSLKDWKTLKILFAVREPSERKKSVSSIHQAERRPSGIQLSRQFTANVSLSLNLKEHETQKISLSQIKVHWRRVTFIIRPLFGKPSLVRYDRPTFPKHLAPVTSNSNSVVVKNSVRRRRRKKNPERTANLCALIRFFGLIRLTGLLRCLLLSIFLRFLLSSYAIFDDSRIRIRCHRSEGFWEGWPVTAY